MVLHIFFIAIVLICMPDTVPESILILSLGFTHILLTDGHISAEAPAQEPWRDQLIQQLCLDVN